jgi:pimeloyl-ACP methyl ester carboxylesterase
MIAEMEKRVSDLRSKVIIEGAGHCVQAEKPGPVNEALIAFLKSTK